MNKLFTASLALLGILFFNAELKAQINSTSFASAVTLTSGSSTSSYPLFLAVADLDGDGKPDIVAPNAFDNSISVFQNTCTPGNITATGLTKTDYVIGMDPFRVCLFDLDGDGKKDVLIINGGGSATPDSIAAFLNTSTTPGTISLGPVIRMAARATASSSLADVDGDGKPDLVALDFFNDRVRVYRNTSTPGSISFSSTPVMYTTSAGPAMVTFADFDADGKTDMAITAYSNGNIINIFRNTSTGTGSISFTPATGLSAGAGVNAITTGDLNKDGKPDLIVANINSARISVFKNTSSSSISFASLVNFTTGTNPQTMEIVDYDKDGFLDIAVANRGSNNISVFRNLMSANSNITSSGFSAANNFAVGNIPLIGSGDIDGDGRIDLISANSTSGTITVLRNMIVPSGNLVAYYPLDGNAGDSSGNYLHGTDSNIVATSDRFGVANRAYYFNGAAKVTFPGEVMQFNTYTYTTWLKVDSMPANGKNYPAIAIGNMGALGDQVVSVANNYSTPSVTGILGISYGNPSTYPTPPSRTPVNTLPSAGVWHHVVSVRDSIANKLILYIDGVKVTEDALVRPRAGYATPVKGTIGYRIATDSQYFKGSIDEVRIYNKAFSATEVLAMYESETRVAYYSKSTGALNDLATWGTNADGSGTQPLSFDSSNVIYIVTNTTAPYLTGNLTINGTGSILKLGDGSTAFNLVVPAGNTITCDSVYVRNNITFTVQGSVAINKLGAETGSTVQLISTAPQNIIKGSYHNLSVSGGMKTLTGATTVRNALDMFTSIDCASNLFTIGTSVNQLGVINRMTGTIIGPLTRWFANTVNVSSIFPIGTASSYRGIQIAFPDPLTSGGTITASFVATAPGNVGLPLFDFPVFVDKVSPIGYWKLATAGGLTGNNYDVNVTAADITGVTDYTQLRLLKRNTGGAWTLVGSNASATGSNTSPTVYRNGVSGFNAEFGIGGDQSVNPLPVKLIIFTAKAKDKNTVNLEWKTSSEINNHHFDVERSEDGKTFEKMGEVKGAGNSNRVTSYAFTDKLADVKPVWFYRLKQVDNNGDFTYSDVIGVRFNATGNLVLYPNPSNGILYVNGLQQEAVVSDLLGNEVMKINGDGMIDVSALKQGVYFIRSGCITQKFIRN